MFSPETSVHVYQTTRCHIADNSIFLYKVTDKYIYIVFNIRNGQLVLRLLSCVKLSGRSQSPTHLDIKVNLYENSDSCSVMYGCWDVYFVV